MFFRFLFLILIVFSSCQKSTPPNHLQTLRINIGSDPKTLDPRKVRDLTDVTLIHMLFEGLTRISKTGKIEMALAHDVQVSDDGTQYVFHLRKSFWSNGDPLTSLDFTESWKSILDPQFPTDMAYQLYVIKNARLAKLGEVGLDKICVQAPDPYTLVVDLEQPIPYFLELVSMPSFYPIPHRTAMANPDWAVKSELYISNGPFVLESWKNADHIRIVKNNKYWESKKVNLEGIDLFMISGDTEVRMFEEGKLDWAGSPLSTIPIDAVRHLKTTKKLHVNPFSATYFYRVNTAETIQGKKNPLKHPLFRKALALSMDRKSITEHILQGGHLPAQSLVPPEMGLSEKGYFHDDHAEKARAFLTDALLELDLTRETLESITISYSSSDRNASIAQAIQKQWETVLGIKVELESVEPKIYYKRVSKKEFQLAAGSWTADFNDPINFLEVFKFKDASTNNTNWESAKYIDLLNRSALCMNSEERKGLLRDAEQILMEQMPIIPVFHFALNYLQCDRLQDVALSPLGQIDFRWAQMSTRPSLKMR